MKIGLSQRVLTHNGIVHDSLERNWYRFLSGHELLPIPNCREDLDYETLADSLDLLILTGGGNEEIRVTTEIYLATEMVKLGKPILGVCHGAFLLTEILGGRTGEKQDHMMVDHLVYNNGSPYTVNSYHNIFVDKPPPDSVVLCTDEDGDVEAWYKGNICAIVWHPERMLMPYVPSEIMEATCLKN